MDENPIESQETIIPDAELEIDLTPDGTEDADALTEKLQQAERAKKQILARAKKAEEELKNLKKPITRKEEPQAKVDISEEIWTIADYIREGYSREDVDFVLRNGGREALKDPNSFVSLALKAKHEQRKAEEEASKTSTASGMSEVERKYTEEQLKNMSIEELEKILPKNNS